MTLTFDLLLKKKLGQYRYAVNCVYSGGISVSHMVNVLKFENFLVLFSIKCFSKESDPDDT